jgi:hypothetical protein
MLQDIDNEHFRRGKGREMDRCEVSSPQSIAADNSALSGILRIENLKLTDMRFC